jgi:hypothetical protein
MAIKQKKYTQAVKLFTDALNIDYDNSTANQKLEEAKKLEEAERKRLEELAAKKQADLDEINRKKREAADKEREFIERSKLAREQAKLELIARIEAQKKALAMADKFKVDKNNVQQAVAVVKEQNSTVDRYELAKKYPQGATNEEIEGSNYTIFKTIMVKGQVGDEYKKIRYNYGQVYFKKNDRDISEAIYNKETQN